MPTFWLCEIATFHNRMMGILKTSRHPMAKHRLSDTYKDLLNKSLTVFIIFTRVVNAMSKELFEGAHLAISKVYLY